MNKKFNKNAKVEKFTTMLGIAVRLIVIDPLLYLHVHWFLPDCKAIPHYGLKLSVCLSFYLSV